MNSDLFLQCFHTTVIKKSMKISKQSNLNEKLLLTSNDNCGLNETCISQFDPCLAAEENISNALKNINLKDVVFLSCFWDNNSSEAKET